MNQPPSNKNSHEDEQLKQWLLEAERTEPTARPEHVAQVRQALIAEATRVARPPRGWMRSLWPMAAVTAATVVFLLLPSQDVGVQAWAQVEKALRSRSWIHSEAALPDGGEIQTWISPKRSVAAVKSGEWVLFDDYRAGLRHEYVPDQETIIRSQIHDIFKEHFKSMVQIFAALFQGEERLSVTGEETTIIAQERREIEDGGRKWIEFHVELRFKGITPDTHTTVYRVDPETNLPVTAVYGTGKARRTVAFRYPDSGPTDIYALGVPDDMKLVDRVPPPELDRILDRRLEARKNFDSYYGVIVWVRDGTHWSRSTQVKRIWRKGLRWRVEFEEGPRDQDELDAVWKREIPADGVDPQTWWFEEVKRRRFRPVLVSDGKEAYRFKQKVIEVKNKRGQKVQAGETLPAEKDYMSLNPMDPTPSGIIHPEYHVYGSIGVPSSKSEARLTPEPQKGPRGTVLVDVRRHRAQPKPTQNDLSRFWIDPLENGMTRRWQMFSQFGEEKLLLQEEVLSTARTPKGYLYPTQLRRDENGVTYFYLDFEAALDDSVFDPTLKSGAPAP